MASSSREMVQARLNRAIEHLNGAYSDICAAARIFEPQTLLHDMLVQKAQQVVVACKALVTIRDSQRTNGGPHGSG